MEWLDEHLRRIMKKRWRVALRAVVVVVAVLAGLVYLVMPESHTYDIGSGQQIHVKKTVTTRSNWEHSGTTDVAEFVVSYRGAKVGPAELNKRLGVTEPEELESPSITDAVELAPDDFLLLLQKSSQVIHYDLVRIRAGVNPSALHAEVIKVGAGQSGYSWFLESRLPGWVRIVDSDEAQFMIQRSPFRIVSLGQGNLAKVAFPYAFVANRNRNEPQLEFRAVDLEKEKTAALLTLDHECFSLPQFNFNYTKAKLPSTESDPVIAYDDGPAWWDGNVDWNPQAGVLALRPEHMLAAPVARFFSVHYVANKAATQPDTRAHGAADPRPVEDVDEIDRVPALAKDCTKLNPRGVEKARATAPDVENIGAANFCLEAEWPVDPAMKNKVCGAPTRKKVFSRAGVAVNEVTLSYRPLGKEGVSIPVVVPEIDMNGNKIITFENRASSGVNDLKAWYVLNDSQVLFKARRNGPWVLYLLDASEKEASVAEIGLYAYPAGPFVSIGNGNFLYDSQSGTLVRKKPFGYRDSQTDLADIRGTHAVYVFPHDGKIRVQVAELGPDPGMKTKSGPVLDVPLSCFGEDHAMEKGIPVKAREASFQRYFEWSADQSTVRQKAPCPRA